MNFWEIIFLFFAFQAFVIAIFFFAKRKGDRVANSILGVFLVLFGLNLIYNVLYWSELLFTKTYVSFYGMLALIWSLYAPLLYCYAHRVMHKKRFQWSHLIHLLPFFFTLWCYFPMYSSSPVEKRIALQNGTFGELMRLPTLHIWILALIMIFYVVFTYFSFKDHNVSRNKKRWFHWILGSFASYVIAMLAYFILSRFGLIDTSHDYFIMFTIILFIGAMVYFGFKQPQIFAGLSMDAILPFKKYQKTGLTPIYSSELKEQLLQYFEESKPHLNTELRLTGLANELNISRHHTSQIINEHFDASFFDFVNKYRIEEAKTLLLNDPSLSITDVIFASGFNNRVSFYKAFKKHLQMTPTQFKQQQL